MSYIYQVRFVIDDFCFYLCYTISIFSFRCFSFSLFKDEVVYFYSFYRSSDKHVKCNFSLDHSKSSGETNN